MLCCIYTWKRISTNISYVVEGLKENKKYKFNVMVISDVSFLNNENNSRSSVIYTSYTPEFVEIGKHSNDTSKEVMQLVLMITVPSLLLCCIIVVVLWIRKNKYKEKFQKIKERAIEIPKSKKSYVPILKTGKQLDISDDDDDDESGSTRC